MTNISKEQAVKWIHFVRKYGPIAANDSAYEEHTRRAAKRANVEPFYFEHPFLEPVVRSLTVASGRPRSVILTGTAGDGKTHLCRKVWERFGGEEWNGDDPYMKFGLDNGMTLHYILDLSAWVPLSNEPWPADKEALLHLFCDSIYCSDVKDIFLIAVNDGQLIETWKRLADTQNVLRTRKLIEDLLVEDRVNQDKVFLDFFNLSRSSSAQLFDKALESFLNHEGWKLCFEGENADTIEFGDQSPIRRNFEVLSDVHFQKRLRSLLELCDYNRLHIPIREILALLSNAVLGHPHCKDGLMAANDVRRILQEKTVSKASIYNNVFGGNLKESRSDAISVFHYLKRFRIGYETTNHIDNILIFGGNDDNFKDAFEKWILCDQFYGADESYKKGQQHYLESSEENEDQTEGFISSLVALRRSLFFKIKDEDTTEINLWDLSAFSFAGEYLSEVVLKVKANLSVSRPIIGRIILGLNRIFIGMLVASDDKLFVATSSHFTTAKTSHFLEDNISVRLKHGEKIEVVWQNDVPILKVWASRELFCDLELNLVRFEFLSRVATGALPSSFSKECYEDILAFKSQIFAMLICRNQELTDESKSSLSFVPLKLDSNGTPVTSDIEIEYPSSFS